MYRLAGHLKMTVENLCREMDAIEFAEWIEFYALEPFGCEANDIRAAIVAISADQGRSRSSRISDYMPAWAEKPRPRVMTDEQMKAIAKNFFGEIG